MIMKFKKNFKIKNLPVTENRIFIIAEIACGHGGYFKKAKKLIDVAVDAKADAVQFEIFDPDTCCIPGTDENLELHDANFSKNEWIWLLNYAKKKNIIRSVFAYDLKSLNFAINQKVEMIKFNSSDLLNIDMLNRVAKTNIPITLGTGSSSIQEINSSLKYLYKRNKKIKLILMHGVQNFPTSPKNERVQKLDVLKKKFNCNIGYANHTEGDNIASSFVDLIAVGKNISVLEKHITINRKLKEYDYFSSLEPNEFKQYVKNIRFAEIVNSNKKGFDFTPSDKIYRIFQKKSIVASRNIKKGEKLTKKNLIFIRNMKIEGISPINFIKIKGKTAKLNIKQYDVIKSKHFADV
jgi:N,N'-diacetyllegionaminate synthase